MSWAAASDQVDNLFVNIVALVTGMKTVYSIDEQVEYTEMSHGNTQIFFVVCDKRCITVELHFGFNR